MDFPRQQYLLRTQYEIDLFREQYSGFIQKYGEQYRQWFQRLPMFEWVPLPIMNDKMARAVIGLLCILYIDGHINLTVNSEVSKVYRGPLSEEEYNEYIKQNFKSFKQ